MFRCGRGAGLLMLCRILDRRRERKAIRRPRVHRGSGWNKTLGLSKDKVAVSSGGLQAVYWILSISGGQSNSVVVICVFIVAVALTYCRQLNRNVQC